MKSPLPVPLEAAAGPVIACASRRPPYAREHGYSALGTTLSVSPLPVHRIIREELQRPAPARASRPASPTTAPSTTRPPAAPARAHVPQNYCGCRFSDAEAAAEREERRAARRAAPRSGAAAHADERAAAEAERARTRAEKQAYADKQAKSAPS